jgi:hypothetical protein
MLPNFKLWYLDEKDENGKIVFNPHIRNERNTRT